MDKDGLFPELKPGSIHTWLIEIDDQPHDVSSLMKLLSQEERDRSARYRFEQDRLRFVIRRGILRQLLSNYTGIGPADIEYCTNPHGKLSLLHHRLHFSVSHSQNKIAYAFSREQEIGVDIEQVRPMLNLAQMAKTWFSLEECTELFSLGPSEQLDGFYHIWTQKEAFIKAVGEGLTYPLKDFSVTADPHNPGRLHSLKNNDPSQWTLLSYVHESGWRMAVCVRSIKPLEVKQYKKTFHDFLLPTNCR